MPQNNKLVGLITAAKNEPLNIDNKQELIEKTADSAYLFVLVNMLDSRMSFPLAVIFTKGKSNSLYHVQEYNKLWQLAKKHHISWKFMTFDADTSTLALRSIVPDFPGFIGYLEMCVSDLE